MSDFREGRIRSTCKSVGKYKVIPIYSSKLSPTRLRASSTSITLTDTC